MKIETIFSRCVGRISNGYQTDESSLKSDRIYSLIQSGRSVVIPELFKTNKKVHPAWVQIYYPVYDERLQESKEFTVYPAPQNILLDSVQNSVRYVGSSKCFEQFRVVYSPGEMANLLQNQVTSPRNGRNVFALYWDSIWKVWNRNHTRIRDIQIDAIYANPFDIPNWNSDLDEYPLDEKGIEMVEEYVYAKYLVPSMQSPPDTISNSQEDRSITKTTK